MQQLLLYQWPWSQRCQHCAPSTPPYVLEPKVILTCCLSLSLSTSRSTVSPMAQRSSALNRSEEFLCAWIRMASSPKRLCPQ